MTTPETNAAIQSLAESAERMANFCDILQAGIVAAKKNLDDIAVRIDRAFQEDSEWPTKLGFKFAAAFRQGMMGMGDYE